MNKENILEILKSKSGEVVSGGYISMKLNISRNAVWKNINTLKKEGYDIISVKNKGYMLDSNVSYLNKKEIFKHLETKYIGNKTEILDRVDSTLNYIKNLKEDEKVEGMVVISDEQTGGRGRRGRSFFSPKDSSIYLSILLKPRFSLSDINLITVICGISVVSAVKKVTGIDCDIKWVNDVFIDGRKICGILTEGILSVENGSIDSVIIGVGINVNRPEKENVPEELKNIIGFINDYTNKTENRNKIIAEFLNEFEKRYLQLDKNILYKEYKEKMLYLNENIECYMGKEKLNGTLVDLNKDFSINVITDSGEVKNFNSGEISIRRNN